MSTDQAPATSAKYSRSVQLDMLLLAARVDTAALHALYRTTAPLLSAAMSFTNDAVLVQDVLVRVYLEVGRCPRSELAALTDDGAVLRWLLRTALTELARARQRAAADDEHGATLAASEVIDPAATGSRPARPTKEMHDRDRRAGPCGE